jgi:hypothetical protein
MIRAGIAAIGLGGGALVALGAATRPATLTEVKAGMWELSGLPGASAPARVCIADVDQLTRYEHRAKNCTGKAISDTGRSTVIEYSCGSAAGFGRTKIDMITPRNLKINTQGISDSLPFNYTLSARRVGDCAK